LEAPGADRKRRKHGLRLEQTIAIRALSCKHANRSNRHGFRRSPKPRRRQTIRKPRFREATSKTAASFQTAIIDTIEHQPYTAVAIAFGIGWLFGDNA
jgi:hypothetical protein